MHEEGVLNVFFLRTAMPHDVQAHGMNPLEPHQPLKSPADAPNIDREAHPQQVVFAEDSAVTKAEKLERHGGPDHDLHESPTKRIKINPLDIQVADENGVTKSERRRGVAPIKSESVLWRSISMLSAYSAQISGLSTGHGA